MGQDSVSKAAIELERRIATLEQLLRWAHYNLTTQAKNTLKARRILWEVSGRNPIYGMELEMQRRELALMSRLGLSPRAVYPVGMQREEE